MRYEVVIIDERDLDALQPESALMEGNDLEDCQSFLAEYLGDTTGIVEAFIVDTKTAKKIYEWKKK